ncbi:MAG: hypothetical protein A2270_01320 [Elusimicrobia bacterium RIFOXYA12_FULL_51_18]|nr:MAG: hypothetical protein A2270_01320 [Elusimicrobia bacterium RIFOXYA12_FULL_51_18]OGS30029.1 MAG: hypothetical protein A2218_12825 [Elusimicrobia bacterium RIFOXYA2_FULL_53_38]
MSKKDRKRGLSAPFSVQDPDIKSQVRPDNAPSAVNAPDQPVLPHAPEVPEQFGVTPADASRKYFIIFWSVIVLAAAAAWILAIVLPGVSESVIERWMMAVLAASLAVFLFFYK